LVIDVKSLHVRFKTENGVVHAVNGVDFSIGKGESFCLVGESGCGKSVTALSVMGLLPETSSWVEGGEIMFMGENLLDKSKPEMRHIRGNKISMIFQEPMTSLNPVYKIGEQIMEALLAHSEISRKDAARKSVQMLESVRIPDPEKRFNEYPHCLSGGMRQRVMIAMALICQPELLIADEPTTALDVTIQAQILRLINDLQGESGTALLLITHDLGVVAEIADKVAVMYTGMIVESAPVKDLYKTPLHPYTRGLIKSIPHIDAPLGTKRKLPVIEGSVPSLVNLPSGCTFKERCPSAVEKCAYEIPPMIEKDNTHKVRCWLYV